VRGKADHRVVRQLPYSVRLTKQKFKRDSKKIQKRGPDSGLFFCSPLFQHSLGNAQHGANFGAVKRPKKRGWKSALKTAVFCKQYGQKMVTRRASPSSSPKTMWSRTYRFPKRNPQVCQMLRIHCLRCHHTFRFPSMLPSNQCDHQNNQGCGNLWFVLCPNRQPASANTPDLDIFLLARIHCAFHALTHEDVLCSMGPLSHANTFEGKSTLIPAITSVFTGTLHICWFPYSFRVKLLMCS